MSFNPGDWIILNYKDPDGVVHPMSRQLTDRVDINELIVYRNDGEYGIDYSIANHYGTKH